MKIKKKARKKLRKEAIKTITSHSFIIDKFRAIFEMYDSSDKKVAKEIKRMIANHLENGVDDRDDMEKFMDDMDDYRGNGGESNASKKFKRKSKGSDDDSGDDLLDFNN